MYVSGRRGSLEPTIDRKRQLYRKFVDYYSRSFGFARINIFLHTINRFLYLPFSMCLLLIYLVVYSFIHLFNCILVYLSVCTYVLFVNVQLSSIYLLVHSFDNLFIYLSILCIYL